VLGEAALATSTVFGEPGAGEKGLLGTLGGAEADGGLAPVGGALVSCGAGTADR
jgi:hypothetical protein